MILRGVPGQPLVEKTAAAVVYLLHQNPIPLFQHPELYFFKTSRFAIQSSPKSVLFQSQLVHTHLSPKLHALWLQIKPKLDPTLALLNPIDQRILLLRFYKLLPISDIGQILNLSNLDVHQSILSALNELIPLFALQGVSIDLESLLALLLTEVRVPPSRRLEVMIENLILQNEPDIQILSIARGAQKSFSNAAHRLLTQLKLQPVE